MKKKEALQHFRETYVEKISNKKLLALENYYQSNKDKLAEPFLEAFKEICIKAKAMQLKKEKDKLGYITFSMLRTELLESRPIYLVEAFNKNWFFDLKECLSEYNAAWAFKFLEEMGQELEEKKIEYVGSITSSDIVKIKLKEAEKINKYIIALGRYAMLKAEAIKEFQELGKEEELEIRIGEYRDVDEIVYKEDTRLLDAEEIKEWLQQKLEYKYTYSSLKNLDLSKGNYEDIDLRFSDLRGSNFQDSSFQDSIFVGARLNNCNFEKVNLSKCYLHGADFSGCNLRGAIFKQSGGAYGMPDEEHWVIPGFSGVSFQDADIDGADFSFVDLKGANFRGIKFNDVDFKGADLKAAVFLKKDMEKLKLDEQQIADIIWESE